MGPNFAAYSIVVIFAASSAQAQITLPHPDDAVFQACSRDMPVDGSGVPARIEASGWNKVDAVPDLATFDLAFEVVQNADTDEVLTPDAWKQIIDEARDATNDVGFFAYFDASEPGAVSFYLHDDREGLLVFSRDNSEWLCHVFQDRIPADKDALWQSRSALEDFRYSNGAMDVVYFDTGRNGVLGNLINLFAEEEPLRHATYYALNADKIEQMTGYRPLSVFIAEIGGFLE